MHNKVWAATGHRPQKIPNYKYPRLIKLCQAFLRKYQPSLLVVGGALGWDMAMANACLLENVEYDTHVPFVGQESKWSSDEQKQYNYLCSRSRKIILVSDGPYHPDKFKLRNISMVDSSDSVVALLSGPQQSGTLHCVNYAESLNKPVINLWNSWIKYGVVV